LFTTTSMLTKPQNNQTEDMDDQFSSSYLADLQAQPASSERTLAILSYVLLTDGRFERRDDEFVGVFDDEEVDAMFDSS
jgi:hypothetical protein